MALNLTNYEDRMCAKMMAVVCPYSWFAQNVRDRSATPSTPASMVNSTPYTDLRGIQSFTASSSNHMQTYALRSESENARLREHNQALEIRLAESRCVLASLDLVKRIALTKI